MDEFYLPVQIEPLEEGGRPLPALQPEADLESGATAVWFGDGDVLRCGGHFT